MNETKLLFEAQDLKNDLRQKWFDAEITDWRLFRVAEKAEKRYERRLAGFVRAINDNRILNAEFIE